MKLFKIFTLFITILIVIVTANIATFYIMPYFIDSKMNYDQKIHKSKSGVIEAEFTANQIFAVLVNGKAIVKKSGNLLSLDFKELSFQHNPRRPYKKEIIIAYEVAVAEYVGAQWNTIEKSSITNTNIILEENEKITFENFNRVISLEGISDLKNKFLVIEATIKIDGIEGTVYSNSQRGLLESLVTK